MTLSHLDLAHRYLGIHERVGNQDHPLIVWWLSLVGYADAHDETAWCSACMAGLAWTFNVLPAGVTAAARSWLTVGTPVALDDASTDRFDVVVLKRGPEPQPGPEVIAAQGHVGLFHGLGVNGVSVLAGNQGNAVTVATFPRDQVLGVRRLSA